MKKFLNSAAFFILIVAISFAVHVVNRNNHFQECDSTMPFYLLREFPQHQLVAFVADYPDRLINPTSQKIVQKLFGTPFIKNHILNQMAGLTEDEVISRLSLKKPIGVLRAVTRTVLFSSLFPASSTPPLKSAFITPFTSTYSAGSGLIYGLFFTNQTTYENFVSLALVITQFLFHLSALLLFLIIVKLGLDRRAALAMGLAFLFSVSMYSYGYNLGLTIWNIAAGFLWLYVLASNLHHKNLLKRISLTSGLLIFFNYLIIFYWLAFLMAYIYLNWNKSNSLILNSKSLILTIIKSQWLAVLMIVIVAGLFYPPGAGSPVTTSFHTFISDFYYIILNFFSFYNHSQTADFFQFILAAAVVLGGLIYLLKNNNHNKDDQALLIFKKTLFIFLLLFVILVLIKKLGFAPARQILFLAPVLFVSSGIFLHILFSRFLRSWQINLLPIFLVLVGFWTMAIRLNDTRAKFNALTVDPDIKRVVVFDCSYDLFYKNWHIKTPIDWVDDPSSLKAGETYLYVSQTTPLAKAIKYWRGKNYDVEARIINTIEQESNIYFSPYYPLEHYQFDNLSYYFTKPNGYYKTKFKIYAIHHHSIL